MSLFGDASAQNVEGFCWSGSNIGIKDDSLDFGAIFSKTPCAAAGVFTRNNFPGAPVIVGKKHLKNGCLQAIVVNSKNANVATGNQGVRCAEEMCTLTAQALGIHPKDVLPSSTGVIGRPLPMDVIRKGCLSLAKNMKDTSKAIEDFAHAIMTTDAYPKWAYRSSGNIQLLGIAKGAGMIEPNMATMLCYFVTNASFKPSELQKMLQRVSDQSFNRISVDTDTSTSDTVIILANGLGGNIASREFEALLLDASTSLAKDIVRDGEGATKLIELTVSGADSSEQALRLGKSVINSPLVKTAIYGGDPNWGRFVMALGKVFEFPVPLDSLKIYFGTGENRLYIDQKNQDDVDLEALSQCLKDKNVFLEISVGQGNVSERVWGCDLTEAYVQENAFYTT